MTTKLRLREINTALLLIDFQKGFEDEEYWGGNRNNINAEEISAEILQTWRTLDLPIFHIIHSSQNPSSRLFKTHPGFDIIDDLKPINEEPLIIKEVNSAFIGTDLKERLDKQHITTLVIIGLTTNHCISTTTRMAGNLGFDTILISDATATFDRKGINGEMFSSDIIHQTTLANLNVEFAEVIDSKELLSRV